MKSKVTKIFDYSGKLYAISDLDRPVGQELLAIRRKNGSWDRRFGLVKKSIKQKTEKKQFAGLFSAFAK